MSGRTISELIFEQHCARRGVEVRRIPESTHREPDYEVYLEGGSIVAEIKQMDPNERDRTRELQWNEEDDGMAVAPADRVRGMLASGYPQLKRYAKMGCPGVLVTFNNAGHVNYIDDFTVTKAMFGSPHVAFSIGQDRILRFRGHGFGGGRRVTRNTCRALSALCVLIGGSSGASELHVYHNPYADLPIDPKQLAVLADSQYVYDDPHGLSKKGSSKLMPQKLTV